MKATAIFDVLSHWCVAAWPTYEALAKKLRPSNVDWYESNTTTTLGQTNANGDFIMQGIWNSAPLPASVDSLQADEAYAAADAQPV